MRRRSGAGGKQAKSQRRKAKTLKRTAPTVRHSRSSDYGQDTEVARLRRDLDEALEQQVATSEVLKVISGSPGELETVFQAMLENAVRICGAKFGVLFLCEGEHAARAVAMHGAPQPYVEERRRSPVLRPAPGTMLGRVLTNKQPVQVADVLNDARYSGALLPKLAAARTVLAVPMLKNEMLIGVIYIYRQEVRPFTDKQIALVKNFAAQAVIAIENTRLFEQVEARTRELAESLEYQTATSDVLGIISRSRNELQPVFNGIVATAQRLCEAYDASIVLRDGERLKLKAHVGPIPMRAEWPLGNRSLVASRSVMDRMTIHVHDLAASEVEFPEGQQDALKLGHRSILAVPLVHKGEGIGTLIVRRFEVRPFGDRQIALLTTFADQAVIAIENVRLFEAEQERTRELSESLDQQTATSDVLKIISSSPGALEPVFQAMLEKAVSICDAKFGTLFRFDGGAFHLAARVNTPIALAEFQKKRGPFLPPSGSNLDRMMKTKQVQHSADDAAEPVPAQGLRLGGARSIVHVPMLQGEQLVGALAIYRQEVRPFTEKQIELLKNFAAQAVIAIENARLLSELHQRTADLSESLEQQTATSDVLRVISSSPGELKPVFESLLANAVRLCEAKFGLLLLYEDNWRFRVVAMNNAPPPLAELRQREPSFEVTPQQG